MARVRGKDRLAPRSYLPDHRVGPHRQLMASFQKLLAHFTCTGTQHCILAQVVDQKNLCVVVSQPITQQVDRQSEQSLQIGFPPQSSGPFEQ